VLLLYCIRSALQDMFLEVHGAAGDSQASASLLTRAPLPPASIVFICNMLLESGYQQLQRTD